MNRRWWWLVLFFLLIADFLLYGKIASLLRQPSDIQVLGGVVLGVIALIANGIFFKKFLDKLSEI